MNMEWKVKKFMTDFERAIINAFHNTVSFPGIDLKCCWYHYIQAHWRKVQKLGLSTAYETDPLITVGAN
ncbi:unnamed protein product [Rotaria sp. Silwood2]|nr:unnamed protein product [Rotaria sp. Silwood2]CAF3016028.1 unnamed protein product [Rotaria sp. Silwood2]CAF4146586.1 unnamed protein product [Rotaria sp. Silwood2]CAF4283949.1 unnamed protein product [Rotaria sp. Silwood2]CAF4678768.1 unnamed protein product [Rotaria sp. Silwood2]